MLSETMYYYTYLSLEIFLLSGPNTEVIIAKFKFSLLSVLIHRNFKLSVIMTADVSIQACACKFITCAFSCI